MRYASIGFMKAELNVERVRQLIKSEGRTQIWVAEKCGIEAAYLSQILAGRRSPSLPVIKMLASVLNTDEGDLFLNQAS